MTARLQHLWLALVVYAAILLDSRRRELYGEMASFCHALPTILKAPLPDALKALTPNDVDFAERMPARFTSGTIRDLADLAALMDRQSPLGLCLRRSLTRYHFLRRAGLPVTLHFGARFVGGKPDRDITGHAWLTLNGAPYHETGDSWQGFAVMLTFPDVNERN